MTASSDRLTRLHALRGDVVLLLSPAAAGIAPAAFQKMVNAVAMMRLHDEEVAYGTGSKSATSVRGHRDSAVRGGSGK